MHSKYCFAGALKRHEATEMYNQRGMEGQHEPENRVNENWSEREKIVRDWKHWMNCGSDQSEQAIDKQSSKSDSERPMSMCQYPNTDV